MIKVLCLIVAAMFMGIPACAEGERVQEDNFVTSAISDVFDKLGQYTSGEKHIFSEEAEGEDEDIDYERDALGRKIPRTTIRSGNMSSLDETL